MAGPWFAVHPSENQWHELSKIWISDGQRDTKGRIEVRLELEEPDDEI